MATYFSDVGGGAAIFTGYTAAAGSGCVSQILSTAVASTVAIPHAPHKQVMKPASSAFCASSVKMKLTNGQSSGWWGGWSFAKPTAYTAAMKISAVSLNANFKKSTARKVWMDAYNSAGVAQASVVVGSDSASTSVNSIAMLTTPFVTVPAGGFLVLRVDFVPSTAKGSGKGEIKWGATAATSGLKFITTEVPAITGPVATIISTGKKGSSSVTADVQSVTVTETFQDSTSTAIPDGVMVTAYVAADYAAGNASPVGSAAIAGGAGAVTIQLLSPSTSDVVLVCDPIAAGMGTETLVTKAITPTVA